MYNFVIKNISNKYDFTELIKVFLTPDEFRVYTESEFSEIRPEDRDTCDLIFFNEELSSDKNHIKRQIYSFLSEQTGKRPPWGILTGVRPVKDRKSVV